MTSPSKVSSHDGPSPLWHVVYFQKEAFEVAAKRPDMHVFAFEPNSSRKGQRRFVVTSYQKLWDEICRPTRLDPTQPTYYEVIGENSLCKLYFDLEFDKLLNQECNGAKMVQTFIEFVCGQMMEEYQIQCDVHQVINLDATTDTKFSRHLIFNLPQAAFKDNVQAGNFVCRVCQNIESICKTEDQSSESEGEPDSKRQRKQDRNDSGGGRRERLQKLFVQVEEGCSRLFVDTGVYTRNRNFRLYKCIKKGKNNPLLMADDNNYKPHMPQKSATSHAAGQEAMERQFFLDSLITNVSTHTRVLTMEREERRKKSSHQIRKDSTTTIDSGRQEEGSGDSPHPKLDNFILTVINKGGVQGKIRRWEYYSSGYLVYEIANNRWCGNVQRQHKSNHIMMVVNLQRGVYYQKCHDPDCHAADYKSPEEPLPDQLLTTLADGNKESETP